jgi:hypothetical protein
MVCMPRCDAIVGFQVIDSPLRSTLVNTRAKQREIGNSGDFGQIHPVDYTTQLGPISRNYMNKLKIPPVKA